MIDERLFADAVQLASLWLGKSKAADAAEYRQQVEASVQTVYAALVAVRDRIKAGEA